MPLDRRPARILAMQALCQWDVQKDNSRERLYAFLQEYAPQPTDFGYAAELVEGFWKRRDTIDRDLAGAAAARWDLERVSPVERNVMRVALVEMTGGRVPPKAALDEAIDIAREYGGADSPRFVNGLLDKLYKAATPEGAGEA